MIYSLIYQEHKGWYSFILSTLVGFIYMFGFIMMTPQLFINYKLKSVAHIPWRAFIYKALNTFIDDLFAFIIKMPTLHRLSCFRDDLIFFIYLYQRWIYPVDMKRVNEFGQEFDEDEKKEEKNEEKKGETKIEQVKEEGKEILIEEKQEEKKEDTLKKRNINKDEKENSKEHVKETNETKRSKKTKKL